MPPKAKPKLTQSIFTDTWIDINFRDGSGAMERYYCSGVLVDVCGVTFYVLHSEFKIDKPRFIMVDSVMDIGFASPQPPIPDPDGLFDEGTPFFIETKPSRGERQ